MAFLEKTVVLGLTDTELYVCPATLSGSAHGLTFSNITGVAKTITLKLFSQATGLTTQVTSSSQVIPANGQFTWPKPINMVAGDKIIALADATDSVVAVIAVYLDQAAMPSTAFVPRGTWSDIANYAVNDVAAKDGTSYLAVAPSLNSSPPSINWMVLSSKGDVGGVASVNGMTGVVTGIATTGANTFTAAQNLPTGANIASASTVNLDTATGNRVHITGTTTIAAVTLTRGPRTVIFDGILTLTHHATNNNLPGAANITTAAGDRAIYESDGTTVYCVAYTRKDGTGVVSAGAGDHYVSVNTGNGHGSTNSKIRRFTTIAGSAGTAITYADSATLGASFTINESGLYAITYSDSDASGGHIGLSLNSTALSDEISYFSNYDFRLTNTVLPGTGAIAIGSVSVVTRISSGGVVRPHNGAPAPTGTTRLSSLTIRKVGV